MSEKPKNKLYAALMMTSLWGTGNKYKVLLQRQEIFLKMLLIFHYEHISYYEYF